MKDSLAEYAKNNFLKKCPNCNIITEKNSGCNHITCTKCNYQWCWLCNGKYSTDHFTQGKCKGYQFFQPKDEYDIKLAFEGKIQLEDSQIQESLSDIEEEQSENNNNNNNIFQVLMLIQIIQKITEFLIDKVFRIIIQIFLMRRKNFKNLKENFF